MFTDIVGYTAMMQQNEAEGMAKAQSFRQTMQTQVETHHGELLEIRGDGSLSVFNSAVDAVACAKEIQETLREEVPLRIGIHLGDIVQKEGHIFGDAVNIASRIESMGLAGAVLISSNVRNQIKNKPEFELTSLGRFSFKNVEEEMSVYALANEG
ncbi:MAG: adenylate/guanylate cyclase domain-containing protein, partial [Bacteroidetes bacterium]|nr:adenylate/guanylate cyclase domain-containing protein [Bacteroidota bacterium]